MLPQVADLVLLMVDTSYGFEMETFEFLNQLQLHGFPKVIRHPVRAVSPFGDDRDSVCAVH